ncbi:MAG: ABC transporter ATP-binding protein [Anaerolineaceae bacterium]|nr:ABC transporter ATP-binding protein [Anaerolineaceae bacterium]
MPLLEVKSVDKSFGDTPVLRDVSFTVGEGEIVCLLGPSGCGKTTILRIVAGLEAPTAGDVVFEGRSLRDVPIHERGFGLMFQDYALFPHKDVTANVAFGLRMQSLPRAAIAARVAEMLALVGLEGYGARRVYELSGGEQQRVALARSLAPGPQLLMLDEPLGSLDRALREELMNELRAILKRVGLTALYVTHDQEEAFAVSDRVMIMRAGRIVQRGAPQDVYSHPASAWVARFLGLSNLVPARLVSRRPLEIDTPLGLLTLDDGEPAPPDGEEATLLIRPEAARLVGDEAPGGASVGGKVQRCSFRGSHYLLEIEHESGQRLTFELLFGAGQLPRPGDDVTLALRPEALSLLHGEEETDGQART